MKKANVSEPIRMAFHAVFNDWLATANVEEYQELLELRERVAPGQVCSAVSLVLHCLNHPDEALSLPSGLYRLLQLRGWLQALDGDRAAAG